MKEQDALEKFRREKPRLMQHLDQLRAEGVITDTETASTSEDEVVVVAGWGHGGIDSSQQRLCDKCASIVWISPSTQRMLQARTAPVQLLCLTCSEPLMPKGITFKP